MKVRFNKSILSHALDTVQRAAQTKITSNTNNGILIRAAEGCISFEEMIIRLVLKPAVKQKFWNQAM